MAENFGTRCMELMHNPVERFQMTIVSSGQRTAYLAIRHPFSAGKHHGLSVVKPILIMLGPK